MHTYGLRRRLLGASALLVGIVMLSGASAVLCLDHCRAQLATVRHVGGSAQRARDIDIVARSMYAEAAGHVLGAPPEPAATPWLLRLDEDLKALRPEVDEVGRAHLDEIATEGRDLEAALTGELLGAEARGDGQSVRAAHARARADVDAMTGGATALEAYFDARARDADMEANEAAAMMFPTSVAACVAAVLFAIVIAVLMWRAFYDPMRKLTMVARRIAEGDATARMPPLAARELAAVGRSFNEMLDAVEGQRQRVAAAGRLAAIGQVTAGIAHEINNPIAIIRGYLKTMRKEAGSEQLRQELAIIDEEAVACQRIAGDLLAYTRAPKLELERVDVGRLVRESGERPDPKAPAVHVDVEPATIRVDPLRMKQVLRNLIRNAEQASGSAEIDIEGRCTPGRYRLSVKDHGQGLPVGAGARVFEPFFSTRRDGSGLGLAVCYGLVSAHGGSICAEDRPGGGVEVRIELPEREALAP